MNKEEVQKLAKLARVEISDTEADTLSHEFDSILKYVGEIKNAKLDNNDASLFSMPVRNVLREDANPHESGLYTEAILREAPNKDGEYIKVKKIL